MKKRILSLLLTAALCVGMLPTALAEPTDSPDHDNTGQSGIYTINNDAEVHDTTDGDAESVDSSTAVAETGDTKYATLSDAFAAAAENDGTVKLLSNIEYDGKDICVRSNNMVTLDLNGYTLDRLIVGDVEEGEYGYIINGPGNLTVTDSNKNGNGIINVIELYKGKLNIEGGQIGTTDPYARDSGIYAGYGNATINISAGTVIDMNAAQGYDPVTVNVTGGTGHCGSWFGSEKAPLNISGGSFGEVIFADAAVADIHISGGTFSDISAYQTRDYGDEDISLYTLLASGYAFYQGDTVVKGNVYQLTDVEVKPHSHTIVDNECSECGTEFIASVTAQDGTVRGYYVTLEEAFASATGYYDTIKLLDNVALNKPLAVSLNDYYVSHFILDLNGKGIRCNDGDSDTLFVSATLTICDSSSEQTGTIINNNDYAVRVDNGGRLTVTGGIFQMLCINTHGSAEISGGTFDYITSDNGKLADLLKKGYAFQDSDGKLVNGYTNTYATNVTVVEHKTHSGSTCACGYTCDHSNGIDSTTGLCKDCGEQLAIANVKAGETTSYYTDIHAAFDAVKVSNGGTLTLLSDVTLAENDQIYIDSNFSITPYNFTVDWNGYTLSGKHYSSLLTFDGGINVTLKDSSGSNTGGVRNMYNIVDSVGGTAIRIAISGSSCLKIEGGIYSAQVIKQRRAGIVQIFGGVFINPISSTVNYAIYTPDGGTLSQFLPEGYTFAYEDENGTKTPFDVFSTDHSDIGKTVYVISHKHTFDDNNKCVCGYTCPHSSVNDDGTCTACGKQMVASVVAKGSVVYYDTLSAALEKVGSGSTLKLLKDFTSDEPISISTGSNIFYLDLNGHTVNKLTISSYTKLMDTAAIGSIGTLTCSDSFLGATLAGSWSFKKNAAIWLTADELFGKSAAAVSVAQAQITSVGAASVGLPVPFGSDATVRAIPAPEGLSGLSYQWYEYINGSWTIIADANSSTYTSNTLSLGDHYFTCAVTGSDGATVLSGVGSATITQASIEKATVDVTAPTYNGSTQTPEVTVKLNDTPLTANDYDVTVEEQTNAGTYTLTITGTGNYTGTKDASWTIQPKTLTIAEAIIGPKYYDGTTNAPVESVAFGGLIEGESLALGTDFSATGVFDTPNAGSGKNVTVTVTLDSSVKNYTLGTNNSITLRNGYLQKNTEIGIDDMKLVIINGLSRTYEIDLPDLPPLDAPKEYGGNCTYTLGDFRLPEGYEATAELYDTSSPKKLKLHVTSTGNDHNLDLGAIPICIETDNYIDTIHVMVNARDKTTPDLYGELILSPESITYGDTLDSITISGQMKEQFGFVPGTFSWVKGSEKPPAGEYEAKWLFTPTDEIAHNKATDNVLIKVNKAQFTNVSAQQDGMLTYNGEPQSAAVSASGTGACGESATFRYGASKDGDDFDTQVPAFTNAGKYTVYYQAFDAAGNHEVSTGTFTVTIDPKTVDNPTIELTGDQTYAGEEIRPTVSVKDGATVIPDTEYEIIYTNNTAAGTATVTIKNKDGGNYIVSGSTTFEISKADSAVATAPTANAPTYNGTEQALVTAGKAAGGTMMYSLAEDGEYTATIPTVRDAKTYTVWYKVAGDSNHNDTAPQSVEVTVAKATVTVAAKDKSAYTGSTAPDLSNPVQDTDYTVSGLFGEDTLTGMVSLAYDGTPDMTKTGETAIKITGTLENENYTVSYVNGKLTVSTRPSSGHSSSSSSSSTVSASKSDNGSVSIDKASASKGSTVTVTVKAEDGYKLDKLTVTDAKGNTIEVTNKGNGKFSFVMPEGKVTVTPTFVADNGGQTESKSFNDVKTSDWYADAVQYVSDKGLMSGTGDNKFAPNDTTTRAMLMTVLARYAGEDTTGGATWYEKGMNWAKANGVSDGTNPNANITREQLVTMLYRYAGSPAADGKLDGFTDSASVSSYAVNAMQWAVANGIVNGSNGKLNPQNNATRAEVAAILMRFCELSK